MPDLWMDVDAALSEVPVNVMPLLDDSDFKSIEAGVAYNAAGLALYWHFVTTAGAYTVTAVTPTSGGAYDWADQGDAGIYTIEIPASGGASINNDTEGFGWFTGVATGVLPWRGPVIGFRAAGLNNALVDSAYSATRGLTGTAVPDAAADAAGGLPISDAGALDMDALASELLKVPKSDGTVTWNDTAKATLRAEATDALNAYDPPTDAEMIARTLLAASYFDPAADVVANVTTVGSVTGAVGSVTGNVTGSVGSVAAGGITAASIATDAIDADALKADAITEIQSGLALAATALSNATWTDARAGYLDNLSAGAVALDTTVAKDATVAKDSTVAKAATTALETTAQSILLDTGTTLDGKIDSILQDTGTDGVVVAAASKTGYRLSATGVDDVLDEVVKGTYTLRQLVSIIASAFGKVSGAGTETLVFRHVDDSGDAMTATVTTAGDRTTVVFTP